MRHDVSTLSDILRAGDLIRDFLSGMNRRSFLADARTQAAVQHQLSVIGEAVKRLSLSFRARHPEFPWREIAGMRDKLIHGYDSVDFDEVWDAARRDVPRLMRQLKSLKPPGSEDG